MKKDTLLKVSKIKLSLESEASTALEFSIQKFLNKNGYLKIVNLEKLMPFGNYLIGTGIDEKIDGKAWNILWLSFSNNHNGNPVFIITVADNEFNLVVDNYYTGKVRNAHVVALHN